MDDYYLSDEELFRILREQTDLADPVYAQVKYVPQKPEDLPELLTRTREWQQKISLRPQLLSEDFWRNIPIKPHESPVKIVLDGYDGEDRGIIGLGQIAHPEQKEEYAVQFVDFFSTTLPHIQFETFYIGSEKEIQNLCAGLSDLAAEAVICVNTAGKEYVSLLRAGLHKFDAKVGKQSVIIDYALCINQHRIHMLGDQMLHALYRASLIAPPPLDGKLESFCNVCYDNGIFDPIDVLAALSYMLER